MLGYIIIADHKIGPSGQRAEEGFKADFAELSFPFSFFCFWFFPLDKKCSVASSLKMLHGSSRAVMVSANGQLGRT